MNMQSFFVITLGDIIGLAFGVLVITGWAVYTLIIWLSQSRCRHDKGVIETQACDAICRDCGKNLGFIGAWREKNGGGQ